MVRGKRLREKGKLRFSNYFKDFKGGDKVSICREKSITRLNFPERLQGRTGLIEGKRGRSYIVKIKDQEQEKKFIIEPIHLKKINS